MRLSREEVAKREGFLKELFLANPELTGTTANVLVKEKFGRAMRAARVYELRKVMQGQPAVSAPPTTVPAEVAPTAVPVVDFAP